METIHRERLEKLVDFLEKLPEEEFYFGSLVGDWNKEKTCGTICCALGWLPKLFPNLIKWNYSGGVFNALKILNIKFPTSGDSMEYVVKEIFGPTVDPEYFMPCDETDAYYDEGEVKHYLDKDVKPKELAALLRRVYL